MLFLILNFLTFKDIFLFSYVCNYKVMFDVFFYKMFLVNFIKNKLI